eukprot:4012732-Amphidinium_carterae.1
MLGKSHDTWVVLVRRCYGSLDSGHAGDELGGYLAGAGLVMDLQHCRWDALGKVEELLREVSCRLNHM